MYGNSLTVHPRGGVDITAFSGELPLVIRVNAIHPAVCDATHELLATCDGKFSVD